MERFCWKGHVNPGKLEEYAAKHNAMCRQMEELMRAAGMRNYSIWANGEDTIGYYEYLGPERKAEVYEQHRHTRRLEQEHGGPVRHGPRRGRQAQGVENDLAYGVNDMNGSFSKPKLVQVGLVVRDLDKTMQQFKLLLGAEPDRVIEKSPSAPGPKYYLGQERDFYQRAALYLQRPLRPDGLSGRARRGHTPRRLRHGQLRRLCRASGRKRRRACSDRAKLPAPCPQMGLFQHQRQARHHDRDDKFPGSCKYRGRGKGRISPPF